MTEDELHQNISRYVAQNLTGVEPPSSADAAAGTMRDVPDDTPDDAAPGMGEMRAPAPAPVAKAPPVDTSKPLGWAAPPKAQPTMDTGLRDAQGQDEKSKAMGKLGQSITAFTERPQNFADYAIGLGRGGKSAPPAHNATWDDQAANGDNAVSKLMATRKADADIASQQAAAAKAAQAKDPNSETAKTYRTVLLKFAPDLADQLNGATPEQMERIAPWLEKYATENGVALKAKAGAEAKAKEDADRKAQHDADKAAAAATHEADKIDAGKRSDRNHEDSMALQRATLGMTAAGLGLRQGADERDKTKDAFEMAEKAKGHQTSASTLTDLADAETAIQQLTPLGQKFKDLDMGSGVAKASGKLTDLLDLQGTDAAEYKAAALRAMQGVGKIMEGGKLAASDETKYRQMLPRPGDDDRIATQKIKESQDFLRSLIDQRVKVLRTGGYNVPDIGGAERDAGEIHATKDGRKLRVFKDGTSEVVE